ncbi:putative CRISPR-associated protein, APE2256 family [Thermofilum pendens Hrk 5]|uniref:CRISPR-associated protein, APE2256 family n=1 Tax=Thermofilum pendens (strain DSM 2475 / Hrk 5) TaxID=368408 RepID=A1RZN1_THEPD|nr:putative CRISPR-associated protein, APE2256 family [Thermofilum pendens Hrk 5]
MTVGTSILRNAASRASGDLAGRLRSWASARVGSREDAEAGERAAPGTPEFKFLYDVLALDPRGVSAELNAMWPYLEAGRVAAAYLLASDSGASTLCASVLKEYLGEHGVEVEVERVADLGRDFDKGLYNLLDALSRAVEGYRRRGYAVYVNATGGFKPETAVVYAAASLFGASRVYYIHETMGEVVELPTLPLALSPGYEDFARLLEEPLARRELEAKVRPEAIKDALARGILVEEGSQLRVRRWVRLLLGAR